jgi:hypothetical protein
MCKNEFRIFKPIEITIKRRKAMEERRKMEGIYQFHIQCVIMKLSV